MSSDHALQPLPEAMISALTSAGISAATAASMERWKAEEVLELLHDRGAAIPGGQRPLPRRRDRLGTH